MTQPKPAIEERLARVEQELHAIHFRNAFVERNKAWETSRTRLGAITVITYVTMLLIFSTLGSAEPWLQAIIPTSGFVLSTLTIPFLRELWEAAAPKVSGRPPHADVNEQRSETRNAQE